MKKRKKTLKENRVVCKCEKCGKPFSYDVYNDYPFGKLCRTCAVPKKKKG